MQRGGLCTDPDGEVGFVQTPGGFFVGWVDVAWPGPGTPLPYLRSVVHLPELDASSLEPELEKARKKRRRALRRCRHCGEEHVPGRMHSRDVCHGCAERGLGVVH
jgi:hypothetical protein